MNFFVGFLVGFVIAFLLLGAIGLIARIKELEDENPTSSA